ncbi:lymphocyte antigen 6G [Athalia rosae]|uniref:lymphocyte antigen 6G n=1 Tax=Athalia rosae TaxID=37344 RepID=UPI0020340CCA|nr:lymphocyte antigen 6G [Athalia rosae]XP_048513910.1 lymphocyte antigen 6G [Athalia rosae]
MSSSSCNSSSSSVKFYARITILLFCGLCIGTTQGLNCFICGQYNDGVGSITPCINYTAQMHLNECPSTSSWCIKYVSEGSIVRDCVPDCHEKESWSTKTYCCQEDGCNSAPGMTSTSVTVCVLAAMLTLLIQHRFNRCCNLRG